MIYCYGCLIATHLYCNGLETPYNVEKGDSGEEYYMFVCDLCRLKGDQAEEVSIKVLKAGS